MTRSSPFPRTILFTTITSTSPTSRSTISRKSSISSTSTRIWREDGWRSSAGKRAKLRSRSFSNRWRATRRSTFASDRNGVISGYSGTPLPKKLGIKEGTRLTLFNAPKDFGKTLGDLPSGVAVRHQPAGKSDVIVLFETQFSRFESSFAKAAALMPESGGMLWVAWPKKAARVATDLDENLIRDFGLAAGLVDTKVCAIDATWS